MVQLTSRLLSVSDFRSIVSQNAGEQNAKHEARTYTRSGSGGLALLPRAQLCLLRGSLLAKSACRAEATRGLLSFESIGSNSIL